jgi:hypothetical protein
MKRREFLIRAGLTSVVAPTLTRCSSPLVSSGQSATISPTAAGGDAKSDWMARSTGPGVVWAHDFSTDAEVNQFRYVGGRGNDPTATDPRTALVRRNPSDGIPSSGGACLELYRPAGSTDPGAWWRPFSAIRANDNGKSTDDPGANGTVTPRAWDSGNARQTDSWCHGSYAHADYHDGGELYDGTDYYLQFRAKVSARRWQGGNTGFDGKFMVLAVTGTGNAFDLVQHLRGDRVYRIYTAFGSPGPRELLFDPQTQPEGPNTIYQPGGAYNATCLSGQVDSSHCWPYPADSWFTVLVHIIPGHVTDNDWGAPDWRIQIWVAPAGARAYTKVYDKANYEFFYYPAGIAKGWNSLVINGYHNGQNMPVAFTQRYTQLIFSKQLIPCPQF